MFKLKTSLWQYIPATVALVAAGVLLVAPYVSADPAILKGANGVACQLPNNPYNAAVGQHDFTPAEGNDAWINTNLGPNGVLADGLCRNVDVKALPAGAAQLAPALPYIVKFNSMKQKTRVWCRMEDSDNTVYFTRKWRSLFKIEQAGVNNIKITKLLLCIDGRAK